MEMEYRQLGNTGFSVSAVGVGGEHLCTRDYPTVEATVGAAVLGGIALGLYEDESAVQKFMKVSSITKPIPENHEQYKKIMPLFEDVYNAMVPLYEKM